MQLKIEQRKAFADSHEVHEWNENLSVQATARSRHADNRPTSATQEQNKTTVLGPQCLCDPRNKAASFVGDGTHVFIPSVATAAEDQAEGSPDQESVSGTIDFKKI